MQISELYQGKSKAAKCNLWHRNIFIFLSLAFAISSNSVFYSLGIIALFSALILLFTNTSIAKLAKLLSIPLLFVTFSCLAIVININAGTPFIKLEHFYLGHSNESIMQALLICGKSIGMCAIFLFYMISTSISEMATSMRKIGIPCLFIELFILTYKYIYCVVERAKHLMIAQKSRMAYTKRKGIYESISFWISSLLIGSIHESSVAHYGLQSRAFDDKFEFIHAHTKQSASFSLTLATIVSIQALALFLTY
ncbi:CbiQ family ECF transporter T component [Saccharicrinis aurantiacus]|uniref:CbiQ family ECF transporter T component n=1 Tax=Saccharicrinis aurantiacus TaxID=1849719 RepID=UPI0008398190|nr:CbiQ family ECF transporter T component [Saccharicrinis aurantiacus]